MPATRAQIAGWTIYIGACAAGAGYIAYANYHATHDPAAIAEARAQQAAEGRAIAKMMAWADCNGDMEDRDDGKTPAETVAKAIIAKCGPVMPAAAGPPCSTDPKCVQAEQQINLQAETEGVLEERYKRAQALGMTMLKRLVAGPAP